MITINAKTKKHHMMNSSCNSIRDHTEEQKKNIELARDRLEKEGRAE